MRRLEFTTRFGVRLFFTVILISLATLFLRGWRAATSHRVILPQIVIPPPPSPEDVARLEEPLDTTIYNEVFSVSTPDKKYFLIDFVNHVTINPNIIPHPSLDDTWILYAQRSNAGLEVQTLFIEIGCNATFQEGKLTCTHKPVEFPIAATKGNNCKGDLAWFVYSRGPHDGRLFYGPQAPYTVFGSNSAYTCFGQFVQDFRSLTTWDTATFPHPGFAEGTEIQRTGTYAPIEKNYFLFWDNDGQVYAHYDVSPKRAFAKMGLDGSVGEDLAPQAAHNDEKCMAKHMPVVHGDDNMHRLEAIHQATNSLSITKCRRSDPSCKPNKHNTFIFTIFQWKSYIFWHSNYEPYVMLFEQDAPFKVHAISKKPFWIHGRRGKLSADYNAKIAKRNSGFTPWNQAEMMFITSMSWKAKGQKYHGYLDDVLFLAFGIEDNQSAGIDIVAGDIMKDLGLCSDV